MTSFKLGDEVPDFTADSTLGLIHFYEYIENSWTILFSHPIDFGTLSRKEAGDVGIFLPEFEKRGVKLLALGCNDLSSHVRWIADIVSYCLKASITYPILADPNRDLALKFGMLDEAQRDSQGLPLTARVVFIIGPDKRVKLSFRYPASTGRNFGEVLRVIDSLQMAEKYNVDTPVGWKSGENCLVPPSLSQEEAHREFPKGFTTSVLPSGKAYMRWTAYPEAACPYDSCP